MEQQTPQHQTGTLYSYLIGFGLSLLFTIASFALVTNHLLTGTSALVLLLIFAVSQLIVQLLFFLHLGKGSSAQWNVLVFAIMLLFLLIIVIGSLWIMNNLNYRMTPAQVNQYMQDQSGI